MHSGHPPHTATDEDLYLFECPKDGWSPPVLAKGNGVPWYCPACGDQVSHFLRYNPNDQSDLDKVQKITGRALRDIVIVENPPPEQLVNATAEKLTPEERAKFKRSLALMAAFRFREKTEAQAEPFQHRVYDTERPYSPDIELTLLERLAELGLFRRLPPTQGLQGQIAVTSTSFQMTDLGRAVGRVITAGR